jgi:hypothetical protein
MDVNERIRKELATALVGPAGLAMIVHPDLADVGMPQPLLDLGDVGDAPIEMTYRVIE